MSPKTLSKAYLALIQRFPLAPISKQSQLESAISVIKELTNPSRLSTLTKDETDYLDVLSDLVAKYEKARWKPLAEQMTAAEVLAYLMDESRTTQLELARQTNIQQSHISEFLSAKRDLSKENVVRIASYFNVSPELFLPRV